jgi:polysaccharide pyruvyl transferase WcaK-like protein
MYKILIAENIPSLNKGELVILGGMVESFKELGETRVCIQSSIPEFDKMRYGTDIDVIDVRRSSFMPSNPLTCSLWQGLIASFAWTFNHISFLILYKLIGKKSFKIFKGNLWREYVESDIIIIGHNGVFGVGSNLLPNIPWFSYPSFIYLPFFGKIINKPMVIYGGSVGKFKQNHKILHRWISYLLENIDLITLRERTAYENIKLMGVRNNNVFFTADLAFLLTPSSENNINIIINKEELDKIARPIIGFTFFKKIALKAINGYSAHVRVMADVVDRIIAEKGASIIFISHSIGFSSMSDDRIMSKDIYDICKNKDHIKIINSEYSAEELKGLLGYVDVLVGERLHSVINALSMCTPSIMLSYIGDIRLDIIRMIGQESHICYVENITSDELVLRIESLIEDSDKIRNELRFQIPVINERSKLNAITLKGLLNNASNLETKDHKL